MATARQDTIMTTMAMGYNDDGTGTTGDEVDDDGDYDDYGDGRRRRLCRRRDGRRRDGIPRRRQW